MNLIKITTLMPFLLLMSWMINAQDEDEDYDRFSADDVYIKLEVVMCYRQHLCPKYHILIQGNGSMQYEGYYKVSKIGVGKKQLQRQEIANLLTEFINIRFFKREDIPNLKRSIVVTEDNNYEDKTVLVMTDHGPEITLDVQIGKQQRKVVLRNYFSDDYLRIKQKIIETAGVSDWIGSE